MKIRTEREKQLEIAGSRGKMFTYRCLDGEEFSAVALAESGAWRVLNAERPRMLAELIRTDKM